MKKEDLIIILSITFLFFLIELVYFKIADRYKIKDRPNSRSSHKRSTIRGGGIIFPIAWVFYWIGSGFQLSFVTVGLLLVAIVSFVDDIRNVSNLTRLLIHAIAFTLCFYELHLFELLPIWAIVCTYIVSIGCINAVNFMDGINGITSLNALSILVPLFLISIDNCFLEPLLYIIIALIVFSFFNVRTKARCFAGDVGSVTIGYIFIFIILGLMFNLWEPASGLIDLKKPESLIFHPKYILFLAVFGVDSILTIVHRLILGENIFRAHRRHLFQLLSNEMKWNHLLVSFVYASIQLFITFWVLSSRINTTCIILTIAILSFIYVFSKMYIYTKHKPQDLKQENA